MSAVRDDDSSSQGSGWPSRAWVAIVGAAILGVVGGGLLLRLVLWPDQVEPDGTERPIVLPPGVYVALGDSYSAGEGLPPWQPGTEDVPEGDRCHRSASDGYPLLIWWEGMTERRFRACAGADVKNVFDEVQRHSDGRGHTRENFQGLQVEPGVLTEDVKLITITMGGNDVGFAKVLKFCALLLPPWDSCLNNEFDPYDEFHKDPELSDWVDARLTKLGDDLKTMYERLNAEAPVDARIIVLGYPSLFPEEVQRSCFGELGAFNKEERAAYINYGLALNGLIRESAEGPGLEYLDTLSVFSTHEPCGAGGLDWMRFPSYRLIDGWFHPNEVGQEQLARVILCYLDEHPGGAGEATVPVQESGAVDAATRQCFESSDSFPAPPNEAAGSVP
jgi:lysophospholipase L1-like esterase